MLPAVLTMLLCKENAFALKEKKKKSMSLPQWWGGLPPRNYPAHQKTRSEQTDKVGRSALARNTDVVAQLLQ